MVEEQFCAPCAYVNINVVQSQNAINTLFEIIVCGNDDDVGDGDGDTARDGKTIAFKSLKNKSLKKRKMSECMSVCLSVPDEKLKSLQKIGRTICGRKSN